MSSFNTPNTYKCFEYGPFLIKYNANTGNYYIVDMDYQVDIGQVKCDKGPGWVLEVDAEFLDASQAAYLADFLSDLNSTLVESYLKSLNEV